MMGSAILNGFERGFNMMERHKARVGRENRLSRLEEQNENRYQDSQDRLDKIDAQNENRYQDSQNRLAQNDAYRKQTAENTAKYRDEMLRQAKDKTANQQAHYQWQQNVQSERQQWGLIAPQLQNIHEQYFETGTMPEQARKFFAEHPQFGDYSPESFRDPEYVKSAQLLKSKTTEIFNNKKLHEFKSPEYMALFNNAFKSKIQQGIGEVDLVRNAKVIDKQVAQLIPTRNGKVSIGLEVTYQGQDGKTYSEIQPMTRGRTSEENDPVKEWDLKELMSAIEARASMADLAQNGEAYRQRSQATLGAMGDKSNQRAKSNTAYRKEVNAIKKEMRKVQSDFDSSIAMEGDLEKTLLPYKQAINEADVAYGKEPTYPELTGASQEGTQQSEHGQLLEQAKAAIESGASREAVTERLLKMGLTKEQVTGL